MLGGHSNIPMRKACCDFDCPLLEGFAVWLVLDIGNHEIRKEVSVLIFGGEGILSYSKNSCSLIELLGGVLLTAKMTEFMG